MRYGVAYQGSKNAIVPWVVNQLPPAEVFVDLFAGGCAVTHGAILSGKYQRFICNDLNGAPILFRDAVNGKYRNEDRWISRERFFAEKDNDPYVRLCWSFGNNQKSYLYSLEIEPWKKALWWARVYKDYSLLREMEINSDGSRVDIARHEAEYRQRYSEWYGKEIGVSHMAWQNLQSLQRLQRLQSLQSLERLEIQRLSYDEVEIPKDSCVYCDPPYRGTIGYQHELDFDKFDNWLREAKRPIYVSEYNMPEDFVVLDMVGKRNIASHTANILVREKLYVHERWAKEVIRTTLF